MKTIQETIEGVTYDLIPEIEAGRCKGCVFHNSKHLSSIRCWDLTNCCKHDVKYHKQYIYKKAEPIKAQGKIVWIVKEKESGKHYDYLFTRKYAREIINWNKYYTRFGYKPLVIVKGLVTEV